MWLNCVPHYSFPDYPGAVAEKYPWGGGGSGCRLEIILLYSFSIFVDFYFQWSYANQPTTQTASDPQQPSTTANYSQRLYGNQA